MHLLCLSIFVTLFIALEVLPQVLFTLCQKLNQRRFSRLSFLPSQHHVRVQNLLTGRYLLSEVTQRKMVSLLASSPPIRSLNFCRTSFEQALKAAVKKNRVTDSSFTICRGCKRLGSEWGRSVVSMPLLIEQENMLYTQLETNMKFLLQYTCLTHCQVVFLNFFPLRLSTLTVFFERRANVKVEMTRRGCSLPAF